MPLHLLLLYNKSIIHCKILPLKSKCVLIIFKNIGEILVQTEYMKNKYLTIVCSPVYFKAILF